MWSTWRRKPENPRKTTDFAWATTTLSHLPGLKQHRAFTSPNSAPASGLDSNTNLNVRDWSSGALVILNIIVRVSPSGLVYEKNGIQ